MRSDEAKSGYARAANRSLIRALGISDGEMDKPFIGICLGLQVLFASSEEGKLPGLGVLPGKVVRFRHTLKIPQIGWNQITVHGDVPHLAGVPSGSWTYFVHSYYVEPEDDSLVAAACVVGVHAAMVFSSVG